MRWLVLLGVLVVAAMAYVRLAPLPADRLTGFPGAKDVGDHKATGGFKAVRRLADLPDDAIQKLTRIITATPRTKAVATGTFVTRSKGMGFPDITRVWSEDGNLHIHSHLVFGKADLGVNQKRVLGWLHLLETFDQR